MSDTNTGAGGSGGCGGNSGDWNSGYGNSGYRNSGDWNSGDCNSGYRNSGNRNSGYGNSGNRNSGYGNSGDWNSGNRNSGYGNSGDWNSGYGNSGNRNSGVFNTVEPDALFFNKPTAIKLSKFIQSDAWPDFSEMNPCVWIESSMMTDDEKKANPSHKTTGGYLKSIDYKEAWGIFWRKTSEANRKKVFALPNFDEKVFCEITGIDIRTNDTIQQKAQELEEEAEKLLSKAKELRSSL